METRRVGDRGQPPCCQGNDGHQGHVTRPWGWGWARDLGSERLSLRLRIAFWDTRWTSPLGTGDEQRGEGQPECVAGPSLDMASIVPDHRSFFKTIRLVIVTTSL